MTHLRKMMLEELQRRHYSKATTERYIRFIERFAQHFHRSPDRFNPTDREGTSNRAKPVQYPKKMYVSDERMQSTAGSREEMRVPAAERLEPVRGLPSSRRRKLNQFSFSLGCGPLPDSIGIRSPVLVGWRVKNC